MRTVVVVGAGSSVAQAVSYRPTRTRQHPPLDRNMFSRSSDMARSDSAVSDAIAALQSSLLKSGRFYDPWSRSVAASVEQFFADVYYDVATRKGDADTFDVFIDLLRFYQQVLASTTNWMSGTMRIGSLGRLVRRELERSDGDELTIVTFNQDLVLENVLNRLPQRTHTWCLESLYGDVGLIPLAATQGDVFPLHDPACAHDPPMRLLKLHGSMNWGLRSLKSRPTRNTLFPSNSDRDIFVWNIDQIVSRPSLVGGNQGRRNWYLWPLVVPPIYDKQQLIGTSVIDRSWQQAQNAVIEAERLVVTGYSLPDADILAKQMLRRGFAENQLSSVHCINPDTGLAAKLKDTLDVSTVHLYSGIDAYLDET